MVAGIQAEAIAEIGEEGDAELAAGLHQAKQDIARLAAFRAHGTARDFPLDDAGAQIILGGVCVQWDVRPLQNLEQFRLAPMQADEQLVERFKPGAQGEYPVEASPERLC